MNIKEIKSQDNETIKRIARLKMKKYRTMHSQFMAEGALSFEAGISSGYELCFAVVSETYFSENKAFLIDTDDIIVTSDKIFNYISDAQTPQGIMGIFKIPKKSFCAEKVQGCWLFCDNLRDPGNIGTIIRTADAMGMGGVLLSEGCADIYMPKLVRSSMGSLFHTEVIQDVTKEMLCDMKRCGFKLVSSTLHTKSVSLYDYEIPERCVFLIGNESHGISEEIMSVSDEFIKIPMLGYAESLNAGVAAAIIMSEAARKKR